MSEDAVRPIRELLQGQWPGEWGTDPKDSESGTLVYRSTELDDHGHIDEKGGTRRKIVEAKVQSKRLLPGDVLLEASGGTPGRPVGRVGLYSGARGEDALCANFLRVLRPKSIVDGSYLRWALLQLHRQPAIWRFQQQTTGMVNLKVSDYLRHMLGVPELRIQRKGGIHFPLVGLTCPVRERLSGGMVVGRSAQLVGVGGRTEDREPWMFAG